MNAKNPAPQQQESKSAKAIRFGVDRGTLGKWEAEEGLDLSDDDAILGRMGQMRIDERLRHGVEGDDGDGETPTAKKAKWDAEKSFHAARREKVKADIDEGRVVSREDQLAIGFKGGLMFRAVLQKLAAELTPLVAGLETGEIARVIEDYAWDKSNEVADALAELGVTDGGGDVGGGEAPEAPTPEPVGAKRRASAKQPARAKVSNKRKPKSRASS